MRDPGRLDIAGLALAFAAAGLVTLAIGFADEGTYAGLVGSGSATLRIDGAARQVDAATRRDLHRQTIAYVLGTTNVLPSAPGVPPRPLYDTDEERHLADVRGVFDGARLVSTIAVFGLVLSLLMWRRAGPRPLARLVRGAAVRAMAGVAIVAVGAVVAFEPLFLAFHRVFFPQGNFSFDPRTSNLLALYPESYWEGVTLRVGGAFLVAMLVLTLIATAFLRRPTVESGP